MKKATQDRLIAQLEATLLDGRLARDEEADLRQVVEAIGDDREALAFMRNRAYDMAFTRISDHPHDTLRWLQRIDKLVDNTARPAEQGGRTGEPICAFSPGQDIRRLIERELREAKHSLELCIFTITDDRITDEIIAAHRRGVAVRVITDNDKQYDTGSDIARLVKQHVPTRFDPDNDHMHHKFALVDDTRLITGSYNWTRGATHNHENVLIFSHEDTVKRYTAEFERLWRSFG
ncbi:MAG: phospholipase D-like domain-containing protein [Phycisphaerales bacterium JB063]